MNGPLYTFLEDCTVLIKSNGKIGTGFFVAQSLIITCDHVVDSDDIEKIEIFYRNEQHRTLTLVRSSRPYPDLTLITSSIVDHSCVFLNEQINSRDSLYIYGFTREFQSGTATTVEYEGEARPNVNTRILKFKHGQVEHGLSGSPLLNTTTWGVCGIVKATRDSQSDLGGGGISTKTIFDEYPDLKKKQEILHNHDQSWAEARMKQIEFLSEIQQAIPLIEDAEYEKLSSTSLEFYHQKRIKELTNSRFPFDDRFVQLTLLLDQDEETHKRHSIRRYNDLQDVLRKTSLDNPALVLLGAPGSGKSTLLRRLELDMSTSYLEKESDKVVFFISLHRYSMVANAPLPKPYDWLVSYWHERYPDLPSLKELFRNGQVLLLLDGLNEMPSRNHDEYLDKVGLWRDFLYDVVVNGNRIVFSCRTLDYSVVLSSPDLEVPQVEIEPMEQDQIYRFLQAYSPSNLATIWEYLENSPQLQLYSRPYFLRLLVEQVGRTQDVPKGRAELFTKFVRKVLQREVEKGNPLFTSDTLLHQRDRIKLALNRWATAYELPQQGDLIPSLDKIAYTMQTDNFKGEAVQVYLSYSSFETLLQNHKPPIILQAGLTLGILEEDMAFGEISFFHQLLQEYFAARSFHEKKDLNLVKSEWHVDRVKPTLAEVRDNLANRDSLPLLPSTGWEETTLLATAMSTNINRFIESLVDLNLPLAAQCACLPEIEIDAALYGKICESLISRTESEEADLRARIVAGFALGNMVDPRFERNLGLFGDYLLPPMINIPEGVYSIGSEEGKGYYEDESPVHDVALGEFQIGKYPVTNAEFALFIEAGGYEDERWWDTTASKLWLRGEESKAHIKNRWRKNRFILQSDPVVIDWLKDRGQVTSEEADFFQEVIAMTDDEFETFLNTLYASGKRQTQPRFWDYHSFNNPSQPVVGLSWYEARAYCTWLTAQVSNLDNALFSTQGTFRLPTEAEWEAAASGLDKRLFAFGNKFDVALSNTVEGHIRYTTPIGIYPGGETPEGVADLSGNIYEWTSTAFFPYPYSASDGRENPDTDGLVLRVLRGGAFIDEGFRARCACRLEHPPHSSPKTHGFRLVYQNG